MLRKTLPAICMLAICLFSNNEPVTAQSNTPKYEVGAQFSMVRFSDLDLDRAVTEPGVGGRFTYNINEYLAAEAEINFFPKDRRLGEEIFVFGEESLQGGRKIQGLFGVKAGWRRKQFGIFAKARPGFVRFNNFHRNFRLRLVCFQPGNVCGLEPERPGLPSDFSETDFAFDVGGVVELYPSGRTIMRFDLGDTIIYSNSGEEILVAGTRQSPQGPFRSAIGVSRSKSHNLQFSVGVGFRF